MVKYYYSKYNVTIKKTYSQEPSTWTADSITYISYLYGLYTSYTWGSNSGFNGSGYWGTADSKGVPPAGTYYIVSPSATSVEKIVVSASSIILGDTISGVTRSSKKISVISSTEVKGTLVQSNIVAEDGTYPTNGKHTDGYWYVRETAVNNAPTVTLTITDNQTLYENSTYTIAGNVKDADNGDIVNAKYSINDGAARALATGISDGSTAIVFNKSLTFKGGKLFDGDVAITDALAEGTAHSLKVWATDDKGDTSTIVPRSFFVVPNRAPSLVVNTPQPSGTINSDKFTISGTCSDVDGNDVVVTYRINSGLATEIYRGAGADFAFDVSLGELNVGNNAIVVEVVDTYGFKTSKTVKLAKSEIKSALLSSTARYQVLPPKGSAKGVIAWIQREPELEIVASISAVLAGEQEQYVPMSKTATAPVSANIVEDEFTFEASDAKTDITIKLELKRESTTISDAITLITGVLS